MDFLPDNGGLGDGGGFDVEDFPVEATFVREKFLCFISHCSGKNKR